MAVFNVDIETYRSKFLGGARAYLFYVRLGFPGFSNMLQSGLQGAMAGGLPTDMTSLASAGIAGGLAGAESGINVLGLDKGVQDFSYFVKSTSLPDSNVNETMTYWCGQEYKMSSTRRFSDWSVTFLVDKKADILKKFWDWQKMIHNPETNMYGKPVSYMADQTLYLIGGDTSEEICVYKLFGAWPKVIGTVTLDYSSNEFASFDVTFSYQYHSITQTESSVFAKGLKRAASGFMQSDQAAKALGSLLG